MIQHVIFYIHKIITIVRDFLHLYLNLYLNEHQLNLLLKILHKIHLLNLRINLIITLKMNV